MGISTFFKDIADYQEVIIKQLSRIIELDDKEVMSLEELKEITTLKKWWEEYRKNNTNAN